MVKLLRYEEVMALTGLKYSTVRRLAAEGVLPKVRPTPKGRAVRIPSDAVEALIRRGTPTPGTTAA
jgi:excisionase family DNA binding protein